MRFVVAEEYFIKELIDLTKLGFNVAFSFSR